MREIKEHHDGHGLAESIKVQCDDLGPGGASHHYVATMAESAVNVLHVQFQRGPRNEPGSVPGVIDTVLLAIVADRLRCFHAGPFPSREGRAALALVEAAMEFFKIRADERAARGVLGKEKP